MLKCKKNMMKCNKTIRFKNSKKGIYDMNKIKKFFRYLFKMYDPFEVIGVDDCDACGEEKEVTTTEYETICYDCAKEHFEYILK